MRNHVPMLAVLVLLGCNGPGVPDGGIWSKEPITGNGNKESPLTIEDKAISNEKLMNSGLTLKTGDGLLGGGMVALGGSMTLGIAAKGILPSMVAGGNYGIDVTGTAAGFTGMLAGDVTGTQGTTKVERLQNQLVAPGTKEGQVLTFSGGAWAPKMPADLMLGNVSGTGAVGMLTKWTGATTIGTGSLADGGDTVALFTGHDAAYYVGNSAGAGKYGALRWVDSNSSLRLWHQSNGMNGGLWLNATGNIGIGAPSEALSPVYKFNVHSVGSGALARFTTEEDFASLTLGAALAFGSNNNAADKWSLQWRGRQNPIHYLTIYDEVNQAERLRIDSFGRIGIGAASPDTHLHIAGTDAGGFVATLRLQNQNAGGADAFIGATDNNWAAGAGRLVIGLGSNHNSNDVKMTLLSNGNVGIATTSPATPLDVNGVVTCRGGCVNGSSRALKRDVADLSTADAVAAISALRPSRFAYKSAPNEPKLGFIAEDVPDLVAMNDRKSLDPMEFAALLTKVVQEQQKQLAAEQRRNDDLQHRIERLEAALARRAK